MTADVLLTHAAILADEGIVMVLELDPGADLFGPSLDFVGDADKVDRAVEVVRTLADVDERVG